MRVAIFRTHKSHFFNDTPPPPHESWTLQAFQDYCRDQMVEAGFDLSRKISCRYDPRTGNVVFWQEPAEEVEQFTFSLN
jgi:hypothetical protein